MVKIGMIGGGKIAERHLEAYQKLPAEIILADINAEAGQLLSTKFKIPFCNDPEKVFNDPSIHAIDVCVPTIHHKQEILKALAQNKHVFCEKPLCGSLKETYELQSALEKSKGILMVGYLQRFHPAFSFVKETLESGVIGAPYLAALRVGGRGDHTIWKHQRGMGGGVILEMLVHKLDQLVWYFGPAEKVRLLTYETLRPIRKIRGENVRADAEDLVVVEVETETVRAICHGDFLTPGYMDHLEIQGSNGSIFSSLLEYLPTIVYCKESIGEFKQGNNFFHFPLTNLFEKELGYFIDLVQNKKIPDRESFQDSVEVMQIVERIWEQARSPQWNRRMEPSS